MAMTANPIAQLKTLQSKLQTEREDRKKTEEEACSLLRQYKNKYDSSLKEKNAVIHDLKKNLESERHRNQRLEKEKNDAQEQVAIFEEKLRKCEERESERSRSKSPSKVRDRSSSRSRHRNSQRSAVPISDDLMKEVERLTEELKCLQAEIESKDTEVARSKERAQFSREINIELRTDNAELKKQCQELQVKLENASAEAEERIRSEIEVIKKQRKEMEKKVREEERNREKLMDDVKSLKKIIESRDNKIEKLSSEISDMKNSNENYRKEKRKEFEKKELELNKKMKDLQHDLEKKSEDLKKCIKDRNMLKEAYVENDKQVEDFESRYEKKKEENAKLVADLRKVEKERDNLRRELDRLNASITDGSKKTDSVTRRFNDEIKRLETIVERNQNTIVQLEALVDEHRERAQEQINRAEKLQQDLDETCMVGSEYMNRVSELEDVVREVKEEAARHVTAYLDEKCNVDRLKRELQLAHENVQVLETKIQSLIHKLERQKVANDTEVFRLQERLRQHHHAEKEMMARIEKLEQKKKPWLGINSPLPRRGPQSAPPVQLGGTNDINGQLQAEREANRRLQQQLIKTETELIEMRMERKMTKVNHFDEDGNSDISPSAPPPPYLLAHNHYEADTASHSPSTNSAASTASSSDNNLPTMDDNDYLDVDRAVNGGKPGWRVQADVHHRVSEVEEEDEEQDQRFGEFTFTESALNLIESTTSPAKRVNKCS